MLKCLLWGTGRVFVESLNTIHSYVLSGELEVVGLISNQQSYCGVYDYKYISINEIDNLEYDMIIATVNRNNYAEICKEADFLRIDQRRIIPIFALFIPGFSFERYLKIKEEAITVFSNNCWAGGIYHYFGLTFRSPIINMYIKDEDYIRFCKDPKHYLNSQIVYDHTGFNEDIGIEYPVCLCDDILLYFNHYESYEDAAESWNRRKSRINWNNMLVMMFTEDPGIATEFDNLEYDKKICFVPFQGIGKSLCYVDCYSNRLFEQAPFWSVVNSIGNGKYIYIDLFKLLLEGKIEKIASFAEL